MDKPKVTVIGGEVCLQRNGEEFFFDVEDCLALSSDLRKVAEDAAIEQREYREEPQPV